MEITDVNDNVSASLISLCLSLLWHHSSSIINSHFSFIHLSKFDISTRYIWHRMQRISSTTTTTTASAIWSSSKCTTLIINHLFAFLTCNNGIFLVCQKLFTKSNSLSFVIARKKTSATFRNILKMWNKMQASVQIYCVCRLPMKMRIIMEPLFIQYRHHTTHKTWNTLKFNRNLDGLFWRNRLT